MLYGLHPHQPFQKLPAVAHSITVIHCLSLRLSMLQGKGPRGQIDAQYQAKYFSKI